MTRVLVDTHIALWALADPDRLRPAERAVLADRATRRCLSPVSVWEAAIKREAGRLRAPRRLASILGQRFAMLAVDADLLERAAELPPHHADPFDRALIAHAMAEGIPVLTRNAAFGRYDVQLASDPA